MIWLIVVEVVVGLFEVAGLLGWMPEGSGGSSGGAGGIGGLPGGAANATI